MRFVRHIIILSSCIAASLRADITQSLYQIYHALDQLNVRIGQEAMTQEERIAKYIIDHLQTYNHIFLAQHFPDITPTMDSKFKKRIQNIIDTWYPPFSPHNVVSRDIIQQKLEDANILTRIYSDPFFNWFHYEANTAYSSIKKYWYAGWHIFELQSTGHDTKPSFTFMNDDIAQDPQEHDITENIKGVQNFYKIHLMPHPEDLLPTVIRLLEEYDKLNSQDQHIMNIKFHDRLILHINRKFNHNGTSDITYAFPYIVIYPVYNKTYVEKTMQWLLRIFSDTDGIGVHPRFNTQVDSLVYYIQGDADTRFSSIEAFDPRTDYTFLNTSALTPQYNHVLKATQKLINPDTHKPFGEA